MVISNHRLYCDIYRIVIEMAPISSYEKLEYRTPLVCTVCTCMYVCIYVYVCMHTCMHIHIRDFIFADLNLRKLQGELS